MTGGTHQSGSTQPNFSREHKVVAVLGLRVVGQGGWDIELVKDKFTTMGELV